MLKTIIKLPDGTELSSGANHQNAIQRVTLTECVNSGENLILGSTCTNALEATLITPNGGLSLQAGTEVTVYKDDGATRTPVGVFTLEKPTRPNAHTMKVTGYDRVSKLDKDLSAWLAGLAGWPYTLTTFAKMVCEDGCGIPFKVSDVPNGDFQVQQFTRSSVTGRQIMQWLGEICARFCRATPKGEIEFAWYTDSGKTITTGGELYYFQGGLSYEDYQTAKVDAVQLRLANSENGALWPEDAGGVNSYIITGNAILNLQITEDLLPVLANIQAAVADVSYTPCKVSIPANLDIHAGNTVKITDKNGKTITAYVMTKTQTGQKDTLECTGNRERNTTTSANNKTAAERAAEAEGYADSAAKNAAQSAVDGQTQEQIFLKLTKNGTLKGLYMLDGELYVNASYLKSGKISAGLIDGTTLNITTGAKIANFTVSNGYLFNGIGIGEASSCGIGCGSALGGNDEWMFWAGNGAFRVNLGGEVHASSLFATGGEIGGWDIKSDRLESGNGNILLKQDGMDKTLNDGTSGDFVIYANGNFGVTTDGALYASNAHIKGEIEATSGNIGGWSITDDALSGSNEDGRTMYLYPHGKFFKVTGGSILFFIVFTNAQGEPVGGITTNGWHEISS